MTAKKCLTNGAEQSKKKKKKERDKKTSTQTFLRAETIKMPFSPEDLEQQDKTYLI